MKKPNKSGSDYYNYKEIFPLVLLAVVYAEYGFMWIDCGSSGSCLDEQIFNRSDLTEKIEDGSLGLPALEPLGEGWPDLHNFWLGDDAFAFVLWMGNSTAEDNSQGKKKEPTAGSPEATGWLKTFMES